MTTGELDAIARDVLADNGATSSFLGYKAHGAVPYPGVICASVNHEVVHGIPADRVLRDGDLLSVDFGAIVDGWNGDAAISILVGEVAPEVAELSRVTEASLWAGLAAARAGAHLTDISHAIETTIVAAGPQYGIVEEYGGHGIGSRMHMDPHILNYGSPGRGPILRPGMALAIEPMVTLGSPEVGVLAGRLDRRDDRRQLRRALGAQRRDHRGRSLGADRPRRRPPLTPPFVPESGTNRR